MNFTSPELEKKSLFTEHSPRVERSKLQERSVAKQSTENRLRLSKHRKLQEIEAEGELTRDCLRVCVERENREPDDRTLK